MEKDGNFDPQGSREPRRDTLLWGLNWLLFDPQGSREPRHLLRHKAPETVTSIHKALASLDGAETVPLAYASDFDPQGSREPRLTGFWFQVGQLSSIHKALASLDGKNAQLFLHLCHIYMLHIIHLLQIVYQVEISSRNLIVFSGQL